LEARGRRRVVKGGLRMSDFLETTDDGTMREYTPGTEACQEGIRVSAERTSLTEEPYDDGRPVNPKNK
jgi:hypothetical protein